jgi:hypothetical protein
MDLLGQSLAPREAAIQRRRGGSCWRLLTDQNDQSICPVGVALNVLPAGQPPRTVGSR